MDVLGGGANTTGTLSGGGGSASGSTDSIMGSMSTTVADGVAVETVRRRPRERGVGFNN